MKTALVAGLLATSVLVAACDGGGGTPSPPALSPAATTSAAVTASPVPLVQVTGTLALAEGAELPTDARIVVSIEDRSLADEGAVTIGEQTIEGREAADAPVVFAVDVFPDAIVEDDTYAVSVRIEDAAGDVLFVSERAVPVITQGAPVADVEVSVVAVAEAG